LRSSSGCRRLRGRTGERGCVLADGQDGHEDHRRGKHEPEGPHGRGITVDDEIWALVGEVTRLGRQRQAEGWIITDNPKASGGISMRRAPADREVDSGDR
jgi:hypothetical protein